MRERLRRDLTAALKSGDEVRVAALRSALAAIDNAEAVEAGAGTASVLGEDGPIAAAAVGAGAAEAPRRELSESDLTAVLRQQVDERLAAAREYEGLDRREHAARLRAEADVLAGYLQG